MTRIFSKPAMPCARARQTSAIPPVAIFSKSWYFPKDSGLTVWDNGDWTFNFRTYRKNMGRKFRRASEAHERHDCVAEMVRIDYDSPCRDFFYDGGAWAVALLVSRHGEGVLLDDFYPRLADMDFDAAFEATFEQSPDAFYAEFRPLIEGKLGDALALLPTF